MGYKRALLITSIFLAGNSYALNRVGIVTAGDRTAANQAIAALGWNHSRFIGPVFENTADPNLDQPIAFISDVNLTPRQFQRLQNALNGLNVEFLPYNHKNPAAPAAIIRARGWETKKALVGQKYDRMIKRRIREKGSWTNTDLDQTESLRLNEIDPAGGPIE